MGKFKVGDVVKVSKAGNKVGVIMEDDESSIPYRVDYPDGDWDWCKEEEVVGVNEYAYGDVVVMNGEELMHLCPHPTKSDRHWLCEIRAADAEEMMGYMDDASDPTKNIGTNIYTVFDSVLPLKKPMKQKMTVAEICKELGRDIEIVKG